MTDHATRTGTRKDALAPCAPEASVTSTDASMVDFFHVRWPGYVRTFTPKTKNRLAREAFRWSLTGFDRVECFLLDILPHLQSHRVRTKADLLLEDIRDRVHNRQTPEERQRKKERHMKMRELNRRGVVPEGRVVVWSMLLNKVHCHRNS